MWPLNHLVTLTSCSCWAACASPAGPTALPMPLSARFSLRNSSCSGQPQLVPSHGLGQAKCHMLAACRRHAVAAPGALPQQLHVLSRRVLISNLCFLKLLGIVLRLQQQPWWAWAGKRWLLRTSERPPKTETAAGSAWASPASAAVAASLRLAGWLLPPLQVWPCLACSTCSTPSGWSSWCT